MMPVYKSVTLPLKDCCGRQPTAITEHSCMTSETVIKCEICGMIVKGWHVNGEEKDSQSHAAKAWNYLITDYEKPFEMPPYIDFWNTP